MKSDNYDAFVDKFKPKLTTDDCYTPQPVYDVVLAYARRIGNIDDAEIMRPFYPGGDYQGADYSGNRVVVDNPPFSIFSQIVRWYQAHGVRFFLFAPHLTVFNARFEKISCIITNATITYKNGAKVNTAYVTNMLPEPVCIADPVFAAEIERANRKTYGDKVVLPKYKYPDNVVTVSKLAQCVTRGVRIEIPLRRARFISSLDSQKSLHKACFGGSLLVGDVIGGVISETISHQIGNDDVITWRLSERERRIIEDLSSQPTLPTTPTKSTTPTTHG